MAGAGERVAWLLPTMARGGYWHPVLGRYARHFRETAVFTCGWQGFAPGCDGAFRVVPVGSTWCLPTRRDPTGNRRGIRYASPRIAGLLLRYRPRVVFTSAFSVWTLLAVLLRPVGRWRIVVVYDGSAPHVDFRGSRHRTLLRRALAGASDAFVTNSGAGKLYLTEVLGAPAERVFARPYQVADAAALTAAEPAGPAEPRRPVFLYVGRLVPGKGVHVLLDAAARVHALEGARFTVRIAGDGPQRDALVRRAHELGVAGLVEWTGWVDYGRIGELYRRADAVVLPTFEDVWGMVVLEAMTLGKPVLCSRLAGAAELVRDGVNGFLFDPSRPDQLAAAMRRIVCRPGLAATMGERARDDMAEHSPAAAAEFLARITRLVLADEPVHA